MQRGGRTAALCTPLLMTVMRRDVTTGPFRAVTEESPATLTVARRLRVPWTPRLRSLLCPVPPRGMHFQRCSGQRRSIPSISIPLSFPLAARGSLFISISRRHRRILLHLCCLLVYKIRVHCVPPKSTIPIRRTKCMKQVKCSMRLCLHLC